MKNINSKFLIYFTSVKIMMVAVVMLLAVGCSEKGGDDPKPTPTPDPKPEGSYYFKAMVVGSSGHMTITVVPGDSSSTEAKLSMDGDEHPVFGLADGEGKKVHDMAPGSELHDVKLVNSEGDTITVSSGEDGQHPQVDVRVAGHSGEVAVVAELDAGGNEAVSVYEGEETVWYGSGEFTEDSLASKGNFNIVIKGDSVKVLKKSFKFGDLACEAGDNEEHGIEFLAGTFKREDNKGTFTFPLTLSLPVLGDTTVNIDFQVSISGDNISSDTISQSAESMGGTCIKKRVPNPDRAYPISTGNGYNLEGGGSIACDRDHGICEDPEGKRLLDQNEEVVTEDSEYYVDDEDVSATRYFFKAKKVL